MRFWSGLNVGMRRICEATFLPGFLIGVLTCSGGAEGPDRKPVRPFLSSVYRDAGAITFDPVSSRLSAGSAPKILWRANGIPAIDSFVDWFGGSVLLSSEPHPIASVTGIGGNRVDPARRPLILVHYMPWFEAKPRSSQWGWHWTMNAFDPDRVVGGRRQIASHYYPLIGPYDSGDPAVIEYHLLLMKAAGIDGIIVDWYGLSDLNDYAALHRNTGALVAMASTLGLKVGVCYEDQTINRLVEAKRFPAAERVKHAQDEIAWLRATWFPLPAYLKFEGKPVLLSFGADGLSDADWEQVLQPFAGSLLYLSEHRKRDAAAGSFDWPLPQNGQAALDRFYDSARNQPISMPVAYPRFHDIYKEGKAQEGYPQIPDNAGRTFESTQERALRSGAPFLQIATWNDWGEGTGIEPTEEFQYRDLETVQRLRKSVDPHFMMTPRDLRLPYRTWLLRARVAATPSLKPRLDAIARLFAAGNGTQAARNLNLLE